MYSKYVIPFAYVAKLIPNNPFYMTYPVTLPAMFFFELWAAARIIKLKSYLRRVIAEIYLHKDGQTLEIVYQNQLWKKLKDMDVSEFFYIPSLKTPVVGDQMKPLQGDLFPENYPFKELKGHGWAWKKYYRNPQNYLVIPKYSNYLDTETLIAVFSGKIIDINKSNYVEIDYNKADKYLEA
ncbi:hypothetical protein PPERSA_13046 [Pseudocohnilembus persalinus]|uniref:Uncharacterized protein n=1 Tax=Pseudocohnilembus persalinus TaxID=266149 RepID=A0A0V0R2Z4_PSEPJ|nr:hypothetical protein PPERSA_13046 [Pseudocohnilembus persalinus]|eukprot:KRX08565.1 hypothetical protein PPERSA_13046 [Pseudocohnilembus persalinus]